MKSLTAKSKKIISVLLISVLVLLMSVSCDSVSSPEKDPDPLPGQIKVYCTNASSDSLHWENYDLTSGSMDDRIKQVFGFLSSVQKASHKKVLPDDVGIISYYFGIDGQLIIDFSAQYLNMSIVQETLCRAAIVKTLCQIDGVDYLEFYVDGAPLRLSDIPAGLMTSSDFVSISGSESDFEQRMSVALYFTDDKGKLLWEAVTDVRLDGLKTLEQVVLENLIKGPDDGLGLQASVNAKTVVNRVRTNDGICYVDLSEEFITKPGKISDEVAVYSVVNTLCELPSITKVMLTVGGSERKSYGKVAINDFLSLRPELIEQEKAGESTGGN